MKQKHHAARRHGRGGVAKVPVVIQLEALECGAACLTMVAAYYGKWIPLEQVRRDCGVSRDGSNARNILKAARSYGLIAKGYRYEPDALRRSGAFPCIIHWNFNHFVVLCGFAKDQAILNDPAKGRYAVSMETFDQSFTGVCLMLSPGEAFRPEGKPKSVLRFARKKLTGTGAAFALVVITTVIASLMGIILPGFANVFADRLLTGRNPAWATPFLAGLCVLAAAEIVVAWIQAVYSLKANGKIAIVANAEYMWHVLRMPMAFFSQRMAGDILSRKQQNAGIAETLIATLAPLAIQSVMMVFYLVVMLRYSWILTLMGVSSILLNLWISRLVSARRVNLTRVMSRDNGKLESATVSGVEMIESIKSTGAENGYFAKWAGYQASVNTGRAAFARINAGLGALPALIAELTQALIFLGGALLCARGEWTVGMIAAFNGFLSAFMEPAGQLVQVSQTLQEMRTEMERVEDVMEYPADVPGEMPMPAEDVSLDKLTGAIELKNVTFGYSPLDAPLIEDFSLSVKPGQRIAFVGEISRGAAKFSLTASPSHRFTAVCSPARCPWWIRTSSSLRIPLPTTSRCGTAPLRILR